MYVCMGVCILVALVEKYVCMYGCVYSSCSSRNVCMDVCILVDRAGRKNVCM